MWSTNCPLFATPSRSKKRKKKWHACQEAILFRCFPAAVVEFWRSCDERAFRTTRSRAAHQPSNPQYHRTPRVFVLRIFSLSPTIAVVYLHGWRDKKKKKKYWRGSSQREKKKGKKKLHAKTFLVERVEKFCKLLAFRFEVYFES